MMEWSTDIKPSSDKWVEENGKLYLVFSSHLSRNNYPYKYKNIFDISIPLARKSAYVNRKLNWSNFEFTLDNAKAVSSFIGMQKIQQIHIEKNPTNFMHFGDDIKVFTTNYVCRELNDVDWYLNASYIQFKLEALLHPGCSLVSFRNAIFKIKSL